MTPDWQAAGRLSVGSHFLAAFLGLLGGMTQFLLTGGSRLTQIDSTSGMWLLALAPIVIPVALYIFSPSGKLLQWGMTTIVSWFFGFVAVPMMVYLLLN